MPIKYRTVSWRKSDFLKKLKSIHSLLNVHADEVLKEIVVVNDTVILKAISQKDEQTLRPR